MSTEQERLDNQILRSDGYLTPVCGLLFVLPPEIHPEGKGDSKRLPGVYRKQRQHSNGPLIDLSYVEKLLSPAEAIKWAAKVDRFAGFGDREPTGGRDNSPRTHEQWVRAWYAALARKLDIVIDATEDRRSQLKELRGELASRPCPSLGLEGSP